jgi:hypothetical protein
VGRADARHPRRVVAVAVIASMTMTTSLLRFTQRAKRDPAVETDKSAQERGCGLIVRASSITPTHFDRGSVVRNGAPCVSQHGWNRLTYQQRNRPHVARKLPEGAFSGAAKQLNQAAPRAISANRTECPQRDWLADDAVWSEPLSGPKFPF